MLYLSQANPRLDLDSDSDQGQLLPGRSNQRREKKRPWRKGGQETVDLKNDQRKVPCG
jgi:hypothetical protein